jgi:hypothetical protein
VSEPPLVLLCGRDLFLVRPPPAPVERLRLPLPHDPPALAPALLALSRGQAPPGIAAFLRRDLLPRLGPRARVGDLAARALAEAAGAKVEGAGERETARARERLPPDAWEIDREVELTLAEEAVRERLASPEETIITLSREGDRLERLLRKEQEAFSALGANAAPGTAVSAYASTAQDQLAALEQRRRDLQRALEEATIRLLPNASGVVGPRTAARLLAEAGGPETLLRWDASRLQLAGARRRRPGSPGPRHGVLYGAEGMDRVHPSRRGNLARSLASWVTVALRADLLTQGSVGAELAERRERRIVALSSRSSGRSSSALRQAPRSRSGHGPRAEERPDLSPRPARPRREFVPARHLRRGRRR